MIFGQEFQRGKVEFPILNITHSQDRNASFIFGRLCRCAILYKSRNLIY